MRRDDVAAALAHAAEEFGEFAIGVSGRDGLFHCGSNSSDIAYYTGNALLRQVWGKDRAGLADHCAATRRREERVVRGSRPSTGSKAGVDGLVALAVFLWWGRFFSALDADQGQEISGVEWVAAGGLLPGGAQGDIDAAIVGQNHDGQVVHHLFALVRGDVGILLDLFLGLVASQLILFTERAGINVVCRNAAFDQEVRGARDATVRKTLVGRHRAAWIGVAAKDQVSVRTIGQISYEVRRQLDENLLLAADEAAGGIRFGGPRRRKVDAVKRESDFEFHHFRRRRRRLQLDTQFAIGIATAAIFNMAVHGIVSGGQAGGFESHGSVPAADPAAAGLPGIGKRVVVGIAGGGGDLHRVANHHGAVVRGATHRGGPVGRRFDANRRGAIGRAAAAIVDAQFYGVRSGICAAR